MNPENKNLKSDSGYAVNNLLVSVLTFLAIVSLFVILGHMTQPSSSPVINSTSSKNGRWGAVKTNTKKLLPESDPSQIVRTIFDLEESIHKVIMDGQYQQLQQMNIFLPGSPFNVPGLNQNYSVSGEEFAIVFHVRATPGACSATAHYLLDNERVVDVNGFHPGGKGVLARNVIESCQKGELTVKVP